MPAEATPTKAARKIAEERMLSIWDKKCIEIRKVNECKAIRTVQRPNECTLVSEQGKKKSLTETR